MSKDFDGENPFRDEPPQRDNPYQSPQSFSEGDAGKPHRTYPPGTVPNYLAQSIMCVLCCCWPAAIPAIVYAAQVNSKLAAGDYHGAVEASNNAKFWCMISVGAWLALVGVYALIAVFAGVAENM